MYSLILISSTPFIVRLGESRVRKIIIHSVKIGDSPDNELKTRLTYQVSSETGHGDLWFEVDTKFADALTSDRIDSALIAIFPMALKNNYDVLESEIPISERLYYNLTRHVIPQMYSAEGASGKTLQISAPVTNEVFNSTGVASGMSLGVDSLATLAEYGPNSELPNYKLTHFTYFNVGAHHGYDWRIGRGKYSGRELFEGQLKKALELSNKVGIPLVVIDSNLASFLSNTIGRSQFYMTHTFRNIASASILQKMIGRYYYSAAYNLDRFTVNLSGDSATYEKWLLPYLSTGSIEFFSANMAWSRFQKLQKVIEIEASHDYLMVCFVGIDNCGECDKCRKTLMMLDVLGEDTLDLFKNSFDLDKYRSSFREKLFKGIYGEMRRKGVYGADMQEMFSYAIESGFPHLQEPDLTLHKNEVTVAVTHLSVALRDLPSTLARTQKVVKQGTILRSIGKFGGWSKVTDGVDTGFVRNVGLKRIPREPQENKESTKA